MAQIEGIQPLEGQIPTAPISAYALPTTRQYQADAPAPMTQAQHMATPVTPPAYTPPSQRTSAPAPIASAPSPIRGGTAVVDGSGRYDDVVSTIGAGAQVATAASSIAGGAGAAGVLGTLAAAAPVVGAIGGLVGLGVSWYYANKAQKEQERVNKANERRAAAAAAEEKRRWEINLELTKMKMGQEERRSRMEQALRANQAQWQKDLQEEQLEMQKTDRKEIARQNRVNQAINLLMGTMQLFNTPANREHNYAFWAQRAK